MANYLLVENRQIVHFGPFSWNKYRMLQSELDDLEVSFTVSPVEQGYIKINDNFEIFPIHDVISPEIDTNFENPVGPFWTFNEDNAVATYDKTDKSLDEVKATIRSVAAAVRYNKEGAGTKVTIAEGVEVTVDTSRDGRAIFVQVYSTMPDGSTVNWKFPEGWMEITKAQLGLVIAGGYSYIQDQFAWEKTVGDDADAATTMDGLKALYDQILPTVTPPNVGPSANTGA